MPFLKFLVSPVTLRCDHKTTMCFQVCWAKEEGADYIIAETFMDLREAEIALDVILSFNLPAVVSLTVRTVPGVTELQMLDSIPIGKACRSLLDKGATLVGSNCTRGPHNLLKVIEEIVKEVPPERCVPCLLCIVQLMSNRLSLSLKTKPVLSTIPFTPMVWMPFR